MIQFNKFWRAIIQEPDGMERDYGDVILAYYEGKLEDVIQKAIDTFGDSFYGWGHQGRLERIHVEKV
jgi:hypothetical protein